MGSYSEIGHLVETMPDFFDDASDWTDVHQWLGRLAAYLKEDGEIPDYASLVTAAHFMDQRYAIDSYVSQIKMIAYRALGKAERSRPAGTANTFIPVGSSFEALSSVGKIIRGAREEVLLVDPYANAEILSDFAASAAENVRIKILSDKQKSSLDLVPHARAWNQEHGDRRPLELRLAKSGILHDRVIFIDQRHVFVVGQSFKDLAKKSPTTITRQDAETSVLKLEAYQQMWAEATEKS